MHKVWPISLLLFASLLITIPLMDEAAAVEVTLNEDEFFVSVNPDDPDQGKLEGHGEVDPGTLNFGDTLSVSLSVIVHEARDGQPTGRTWHAEISYDDLTVNTGPKVFRRGDDPEPYTIKMDPATFDPARDDGIPVPPGLTDDFEGRIIVTASYSGATNNGDTTVQARIYPVLYHLVNLSTPDGPVEMEAGDRLIYSLSIKNAGNIDESISIEVPVLDDLEALGFETSLDMDFIELLEVGQRVSTNLTIKAPLEIKRDDFFHLIIKISTIADDPQTLEPASSREIDIDLNLIKSIIEKPDPIPNDDDDDDIPAIDDDPFYPGPGTDPLMTNENTEPWMVILAIGFGVAIILVLALFFLRKGGGEDEDSMNDAHSSNFRI